VYLVLPFRSSFIETFLQETERQRAELERLRGIRDRIVTEGNVILQGES
jgi:ribosomal 50S subunit-associated protein YjgA (DUF615 family)